MCYLLVYLVFDFQTEDTLRDDAAMAGALAGLTGADRRWLAAD